MTPGLQVVTRVLDAFPGVWNSPAYVSLPWDLGRGIIDNHWR